MLLLLSFCSLYISVVGLLEEQKKQSEDITLGSVNVLCILYKKKLLVLKPNIFRKQAAGRTMSQKQTV